MRTMTAAFVCGQTVSGNFGNVEPLRRRTHRCFAAEVFKGHSHTITSLVHRFAVFIYLACSNINRLTAYPAEMILFWSDHFGHLYRTLNEAAQETDAQKGSGKIAHLTRKL